MAAAAPARIRRHGLRTRILHGLNAAALLTLLVTGLAIGERLPDAVVEALGGHEALNDVHQWLGLAFAAAAALLTLLLARPALRLLRELGRMHLRHLAWALAFLRHSLSPARHAPPAHDGDLDPVERPVLAVLLLTTVLVAASGIYLYFLPPGPRWVFLVIIRMHIWGAWLLLAALALHVFAGLGVLPTHRGIARAMFGDGTLPLATARRLWPGWTRRQLEADTGKAPRHP